jgi:hypothetical protein
MRTKIFAFLAAFLWSVIPASAQQPPSSLLDRLIGTWVLTGTIDGKPTTHDVIAEWVLNREYVRLQEVSREKDNKGGPAYEAIVFIGTDPKTGEYTCLWLDSTEGGGLSNNGIGRGRPTPDSIPFVFFPGSKNQFRNTFVYSKSDDTWKWIMDAETDGKLFPFARLTLTRAKP